MRDYRLTYDNNGAADRSRLTSIQECEGGGTCIDPTNFAWLADVGGWQNYPSIPDIFSPGQGYTDGNVYPLITGDWNGDGLTDLGRVADSRVNLKSPGTLSTHLSSLTDSLGAVTSLTYAPLTNSSVYTKGSGATYPELDLQAPMYVVSEVSRDDGVGGQSATSYRYGGAKAHLQGRGLLGFAWMEAEDQQTGIVTRTEYRQDHPFTGQVSASKTFKPAGGGGEILTTRLTNTWDALSLNGGLTTFPYVSLSTAEAFEFNDGVQP